MVLTGCQHSDLAERRSRERNEKLAVGSSILAELAVGHPDRLGPSIDAAGRELAQDGRDMQASAAGADQLFKQSVRRWNERQPDYLAEFLRKFWGRPETIEPNAIELLY